MARLLVDDEIDVTLADLAADLRSATPSEAAERVVPSIEEVRSALRNYEERLTTSLRSKALAARRRLAQVAELRIFRRPFEAIQLMARRVDELDWRARQAIR